MTFDYFFEAPPGWEKAVAQGLFQSRYSFTIGLYFLLDALAISSLWGRYHFTVTGLALLLGFLFLIVTVATYLLTGLCGRIRERLSSSFIDADSRRTLLNASYVGYRLYLIILAAPFAILYAILAARP